MRLRFYAREDQLVPLPGHRPLVGQAASYVGRKFDAATRGYPATPAPFECDSDSDEGRRLIKMTRRDACLWPADLETADVCGVAFVAVEVRDGVAVPRVSTPARRAERPAASGNEGSA